MIEMNITGYRNLKLTNLVVDYNGTLGCDGHIAEGVTAALGALADQLEIHILTADTFGQARAELGDGPHNLVIIPETDQAISKLELVKKLGCEQTVCIGNGRNDRLMLQEAILGIVVIQEEGASAETIASADVICTNILTALELLVNPLRLRATLQS